MKRLKMICLLAFGLMLISTCVSWAVPMVAPPPDGLCSWWNTECLYYAYGWWEDDLYPPDSGLVSPPGDADHWASNFLTNTQFHARVDAGDIGGYQVFIWLENEYRPELVKEIFIYIEGTATNLVDPPAVGYLYLGEDGDPIFKGSMGGINNGDGTWQYMVSGEIIPQPSMVKLIGFRVPGLTSVTNIWAGENCIPEPTTICLLGLGALGLLRKRRK